MDDTGERDWTSRARICIDFGTALSKAAICLDPMLPLEVGVKPLPIGAISGAEHPLLTPSVLYVDDGRVYFGPHALQHAHRGVDTARDPLISFKTVLGATNVQDALQTKLRPSMDPTGTFKHRDALVLYIAYLDQLIREALDLAPNMPSGVINAKRRYTSPVWRPGSGIDQSFEAIFNEAATVSQMLGRQFLLQGEGISIAQCKQALDRAAAAPGNGNLETGIFEPHAAAAAALAFTSQPTRFVIVLDIGAGTNDIAAFDFDESVEPPSLSEVKEARQCSALAGDEVDRILIELILRKAGFDRNNPDDMRTLRAARLTARDLKKDIFRHGKCTMRVGRKQITVVAKELAEDPNFRTYQQALAQTIAASLRVVGQRAQSVGATTIDVVLAGGGSHLPFLPALVQHAGNSVAPGVQLRIGALSPANPLYTSIDTSLREVFPQIAMAVGGALVEMMPAR
ncbi:MAG: Hsp70 family protein [Hyphomonadaceae bacterium]|nr:Hsp70 family protein [Hyphomonadaceae bacterium]MCA8886650.1 Hsp70 family protein [Hyphomonadaceae bacterium]